MREIVSLPEVRSTPVVVARVLARCVCGEGGNAELCDDAGVSGAEYVCMGEGVVTLSSALSK